MIKRFLEKIVQYTASFNKDLPPINKYFFQVKFNNILFSSLKKLYQDPNTNAILSMDSAEIVNNDNNDDRTRALNICREQLGGAWGKIDLHELSLIPISGGMSNSVFCCSLPSYMEVSDGEPNQVLLRFYGYGSLNSDMTTQVEIFNLLSKENLGPKLYSSFDEGRIEEFLRANSLTCSELMNQEISLIIAKKLAAVHSLDVPLKKDNSWLGDKYKEFLAFIEQQGGLPEFSENTRQTTKVIAKELLSIDFNEEIKFMLGFCDRTNSPIVFSHNDLHQGNILLAEYSKRRPTFEERIVFIDFEYCSYNYRGYDIANHFSEWCFEYDTPDYPHFMFYKDRLPSRDTQNEFVRNYLEQNKHIATTKSDHEKTGTDNDNNNNVNGGQIHDFYDTNNESINGFSNVTNGHSNGIKHQTREFDFLLNEVKPFFMGANLLWTLWCIKSAYQSNIKFGYWEHAMARWKLYSNFKCSFINESNSQNRSENNL